MYGEARERDGGFAGISGQVDQITDIPFTRRDPYHGDGVTFSVFDCWLTCPPFPLLLPLRSCRVTSSFDLTFPSSKRSSPRLLSDSPSPPKLSPFPSVSLFSPQCLLFRCFLSSSSRLLRPPLPTPKVSQIVLFLL